MLPATQICKDPATSGTKASLRQWCSQQSARVPHKKKIGAGMIACLSIVLLGHACHSATNFNLEGLPNIPAPLVQTSTPIADRVPAAFGVARTIRNGAPLDPSVAFDQRVVSLLHDTQLFSRLIYPDHGQPALEGQKRMTAKLSVSETVDRYAGKNAFKGFVVGASMFLLTPFLPLEYSYAAQMTLDLQRWDGEMKHYTAASEGRISYQLFSATPLLTEELKGRVTERCLIALMVQLVNDAGFYRASAAPLLAKR